MFNPQTTYDIIPSKILLTDFHFYTDEFVVRPPYQRKSVWSTRKKQDLIDSLFRRYYVPHIVIREVRLCEQRTVKEVVDGQQRIDTAKDFFDNRLRLPTTLSDLHPDLVGKFYSELSSEVRRFVDREFYFQADVVKGIDDPNKPEHQEIATEIFWRLQQGETLTYMEQAHSRLNSLARNFVVKHADDQRFDYESYVPLDANPDKHRFFDVIDRKNDRMQHLALLTRFLIFEDPEVTNDIRDVHIIEYINQYKRADGIGNFSMDEMPHAKRVLHYLNIFYDVFKDDPLVTDGNGLKEFRIEYFVISTYRLLRHLATYYVFADNEYALLRDFTIAFHSRWRSGEKERDTDILIFSDNRQQTSGEIEIRDRIIRQAFFEFAHDKHHQMLTKDERRAFTELQRIQIYRRDNGFCQICLEEGKPEREALVPWDQYQADHVIPHSLGGSTIVENGRVLCRYHNQARGNRVETDDIMIERQMGNGQTDE